jgi:hypothetical protein
MPDTASQVQLTIQGTPTQLKSHMITDKIFCDAWQDSSSFQEVADKLGIDIIEVKSFANDLKSRLFRLKTIEDFSFSVKRKYKVRFKRYAKVQSPAFSFEYTPENIQKFKSAWNATNTTNETSRYLGMSVQHVKSISQSMRGRLGMSAELKAHLSGSAGSMYNKTMLNQGNPTSISSKHDYPKSIGDTKKFCRFWNKATSIYQVMSEFGLDRAQAAKKAGFQKHGGKRLRDLPDFSFYPSRKNRKVSVRKYSEADSGKGTKQDYRGFVIKWQRSDCLVNLCKDLRTPIKSARATELYLKKLGVPLKVLPLRNQVFAVSDLIALARKYR